MTKASSLPAPPDTFVNVGQAISADLNGDGYFYNVGSVFYSFSGFMVWTNRGDGSFNAPVSYTLPDATDPGFRYIGGMAVGDVDKDGRDPGPIPSVFYQNLAGVSLELKSGASMVTQYVPVTLSVLATSLASSIPASTVTFYANGKSIGTSTLIDNIATLTTDQMNAGANSVVAKIQEVPGQSRPFQMQPRFS